MREVFKKRLAVFLTILMTLPAITAVLPIASTEVQAAYVYMYWNVAGYGDKTVQVEKGQQFYVGDYVYIYNDNESGTASMMKAASYSSGTTSVATVNDKGYFTAQNTGITTVTVKYKGETTSCNFEVVPAGSFESSGAVSAAKSRVSALANSIPSTITTKNGFTLLKMVKDYEGATANNGSVGGVSQGGFLLIKEGSSNYYSESQQLVVPQAGRYRTLCAMLDDFASKNSPTSTRSAKMMKIASVSANTRTVTVKLKKKIDLSQVLAGQINVRYSKDLKNTGKSKAQIWVNLYDAKTNSMLYGAAVIQKGKNIMKITPKKYIYKNGVSKYAKTKLKKGKTYRLETQTSWTKGKTVKVK